MNAPAHRLLLVGGPSDVLRQVEGHLEPLGLPIVEHWEGERCDWVGKEIPAGVTGVVFLSDMTPRGKEQVRRAAERAGVPLCLCTRKWSHMKPRLIESGLIPQDGAFAPQAVKANATPAVRSPMPQTFPAQPTLPDDVQSAVKLLCEALPGSSVQQLWLKVGPDGKVAVAFEIVQVVSGTLVL